MSSFAKFRDGFIGPVIILFVICSLITFAVAATNTATEPTIRRQEKEKADRVRLEVLTSADAFTELDAETLPEGVSEAYRADNGAGYVFKSSARGFDGAVVFLIGIDSDGNIAGINMFDHNETPGQGTLVGEEDYLVQYIGQNDPNSVDAVSGATLTSTALKNALRQAYEAYEQLS